MLNKNVEVFMGCDTGWHFASTVLFGAPFDSTTSYRPGTRFGSGAIRRESYGIESYSPYQDRDLLDGDVVDIGDIELCFGDSAAALESITQQTRRILASHKRPKFPDVHIIHFDAHADLRDDYLGVPLSHACVMRRCWELVGNGRIFQFGIRSGDREEFSWGRTHVRTNRFNFDTLEEVVEQLQGKPVYFTLDLDVLDPSVFPGTGTPEPGGVSFEELRKAATLVCSKLRIVGCDVNELSPHYDQSGVSTIVACKIVREMLLAFQK